MTNEQLLARVNELELGIEAYIERHVLQGKVPDGDGTLYLSTMHREQLDDLMKLLLSPALAA